ncbi:TPA: two-component system sensor histidine kinase RcsC [Raoultella ornithinolytica]|uniref:two-component system sensor histidine kinase RcsC n=1 Tax=Raoultella ornithinolytica TaxID=54291 RepID=UPI00196786CC|nr:two-component system sensor histidine kinase RcsC [Raoultella ornithinolytica]EJD6309274.1 two-component system sensor histidine kinase RcsC [Raoultella ornithinolytica]QSA12983.1 two-component system sensor histidine kinase RcsC [Raoultella ornithinolytica]HDH7797494.1 two-component system sensor histidine kinase RcsC [Raoultella ornithinolytica]HDV8760750.1 two-component system sensor histidine kinase RcsC [Raoultella ornithinolytica]HDV9412837.1 two-component system sensor histidine kina
MKYLASFHTTLKVSRYLFRALAVLLWMLIAFVSVFYIVNALHDRESEIRQEFNLNADQAQRYIQRTADVIKELKYVAGNRPTSGDEGGATPAPGGNIAVPDFEPLYPDSDCGTMGATWRNSLQSLAWFMRYWRDNFSAAYDLNRIFLIGSDNLCMANFGLREMPLERDQALKVLHQRIEQYRDAPQNERGNNLFWISQGVRPGVGYFYALTPVYMANRLQALLGIEQTIRMESFFTPGSLPMSVTILDDNGQPLISLAGQDNKIKSEARWMQERIWFGYTAGFRELALKKSLPPSSLSIVYSVSVDQVLERIRMLIINAIVLNILTGVILFALARMYERRIFIPAENDAQRLEEHEQFNRKIVASAPVGICILRTLDGTNILSNELAHNYLNMLTHEDRQRLTQIICGQQVNFVDVLTSNNTNLQISFVHSRYRNENVAICVLVDVSARVKMEESLQEMAQAAEQASQSKSMFLATVSHELRTPLYGIIGNLDLLQTKELPKGVDRLVTAMNNSSSLLLKIISDILDFSKIESEQLKIEPGEFSPREVMNHISANYLPLVVRKQLGLYCFIEPDVPQLMSGDPMRLQQVISNLLSNAIKFTDTGCIVLHVQCAGDYLQISVRDTGEGIPAKEVVRLFDPFFQVGTGVQRNFQGTGLGLAICEKLISMMDGDIAVETEPGMGSRFTIRIPLYGVQNRSPLVIDGLVGTCCWLAIRNASLALFVESLLTCHGLHCQIYDGQRPGADDILLTDDEPDARWQGSAAVIFCRRHIGIPLERTPGEWIHSVTTPHELLPLLGRILRIAVTTTEHGPALAAPETQVASNDDMMILVVDDHPINRRLLADQLGSLGYQCVTANDGVDALGVLSKQHIDIVLSDVNMPNMDGYRLTQRIRELGMTLPVIGVTANALAEEKQRCLESGMDNCLSKPVTLDIIKQTLAIYAARVRKERQERE